MKFYRNTKCIIAFLCLFIFPLGAFSEPINVDSKGIISTLTSSQVKSYESNQRSVSLPIDPINSEEFEFKMNESIFSDDYIGEEKNWESYEIWNVSKKGTLLRDDENIYISFVDKEDSVIIYPIDNVYQYRRSIPSDISDLNCGNSDQSEEQVFNTEIVPHQKGGLNLSSKELTLSNRRILKLALNVDKTFIDKFKNKDAAKAQAILAVQETNRRYLRPYLNIALMISSLNLIPDKALTMEESADLLGTNPGFHTFDVGHLFRGERYEEKAAGRGRIGGVCGASGEQRDKALGYTVGGDLGVFFEDIFAHEVGHQIGLRHTWSECPASQQYRADAYAREASDGSTLMSYYSFFIASCGFPAPSTRPNAGQKSYSASSIFYTTEFFRKNSNCGLKSPNKSKYIPFNISFDPRVPYKTPFSPVFTLLEDLQNITYAWGESDLVLPLNFNHQGRFSPLMLFLVPESRKAGQKLRVDFPTYISNDESIPCSEGSRKWGVPGCFSGKEIPYNHPFTISIAEGGGGVSSIKFNVQFSGSKFGFNDDYLKNVVWTGGKEETIYWHVGGGEIAKRVNIYFVKNYFGYLEDDIQEEFPKTFGNSYLTLASSVSNNGSVKIKLPKANLDGFLLIVPEAESLPFIFWSRSKNFKIRCGQARGPSGGNCTGEQCECEVPTATPTSIPLTSTPTITPSVVPTSTNTPMPSPSPSASPTSTSVAPPTETPAVTHTPTAVPTSTKTPTSFCEQKVGPGSHYMWLSFCPAKMINSSQGLICDGPCTECPECQTELQRCTQLGGIPTFVDTSSSGCSYAGGLSQLVYQMVCCSSPSF